MSDYPWLKLYAANLPHSLKPYPEITLLDVVQETVKLKPDHPAVIFKGAKMSYATLERLSDQFAAALVELGVRKGDRVAALLPNSPQAVIAQLGIWKAGGIAAPMNSLYTERELEQMLNEIEAETVIALTPFYAKVKAIQPKTKVKRVVASNIKDYLSPLWKFLFTVAKEKKEGHRITIQPEDYWWGDLMKQHAQSPRPQVAVTIHDPAILLFSGGTTGSPKAALGSHHAVYMTARQLHAYAATVLADWTDRLTLVMPMFHVYGNMAMNTSLIARWPMIAIPNPRDIDDLIAEIRKERPAVLHGVPTLFTALLNHPKVKAGQVDFKSMKVCYSGAAPLLLETKKRFEALTGGWLLEAYGMTETMLAAVVCPVNAPYKEGSTGLPLPDVIVKIVDVNDDRKSLAAGEIGEVVISAPQLMTGYWNRPAETAKMIRAGWCYTGDIGYLDAEGYLFVVDRKKDLIKPASGFQVWPREVEEVIAAHPAVLEVSVAGVAAPDQSEMVKAWIVLRGGFQASEEEILKHCRERLAGYKVPKLIEFRDQLPKTMVGKVLRRNLVAEDKR